MALRFSGPLPPAAFTGNQTSISEKVLLCLSFTYQSYGTAFICTASMTETRDFFSITSAERRNLYYMQHLVLMNDPILIFLNSHVWIFSCSWKRGNWRQPTRPYNLTSPLINSHHWDMKITARSPFDPLMWLFTVQRCVGIKNSFLCMKIRAYKLVHFLKLMQTDVLIMNVWSWLSDIYHGVRRTNKYHIIRPNFLPHWLICLVNRCHLETSTCFLVY